MPEILLVADEPWVVGEVNSALAEHRFALSTIDDPRRVVSAAAESGTQLVIADMQVGSKGGMAIARAVRDAVATGGLPPTPVILLLDRPADTFLAGRSGADAWLVKPFNGFELRDAVERLVPVEASEG